MLVGHGHGAITDAQLKGLDETVRTGVVSALCAGTLIVSTHTLRAAGQVSTSRTVRGKINVKFGSRSMHSVWFWSMAANLGSCLGHESLTTEPTNLLTAAFGARAAVLAAAGGGS